MSTIIFDSITADAESGSYTSSGSMVFSVVGTWKSGSFTFDIDLGSGFVTAGVVSTLSRRAFPVLIPEGAAFRVVAKDIITDDDGITMEYVDV